MDINILNELVNGILEIMKSSLVQIVLYGSVARGTNTEEFVPEVERCNTVLSECDRGGNCLMEGSVKDLSQYRFSCAKENL